MPKAAERLIRLFERQQRYVRLVALLAFLVMIVSFAANLYFNSRVSEINSRGFLIDKLDRRVNAGASRMQSELVKLNSINRAYEKRASAPGVNIRVYEDRVDSFIYALRDAYDSTVGTLITLQSVLSGSQYADHMTRRSSVEIYQNFENMRNALGYFYEHASVRQTHDLIDNIATINEGVLNLTVKLDEVVETIRIRQVKAATRLTATVSVFSGILYVAMFGLIGLMYSLITYARKGREQVEQQLKINQELENHLKEMTQGMLGMQSKYQEAQRLSLEARRQALDSSNG